MELALAFFVIIAILLTVDFIALRFGVNMRRNRWVDSFDPREEWHAHK